MKLLQNKKIAIVFLFVSVIVAVFIGSPYSIQQKYEKTVNIIFEDRGVMYNVDAKCGYSNDIITIANSYLEADNALISELSQSVKTIKEFLSFEDVAKSNRMLTTQASDLVLEVKRTGNISDADTKQLERALANIKEKDDILEHQNEYNNNATSFNSSLKSFPASFFADMADIKELALF